MKVSLLLLSAALISTVSRAQLLSADYTSEVGIYGGIAPFTRPTGPHDRGTNQTLPALASLNYQYNLSEKWQAGIDVSMMTHLYATGYQTLNDLDGKTLGIEPVKYHYSERSWSTTVRFNRVMPMYDNYHENRSNFYYGVAAGVFFTINDGGTTYSQFNGSRGPQYQYVSQSDYQPGAGYTFGVQAGYNYYVSEHIGLNAEGAVRFAHVDITDARLDSRNGSFNAFYFPITLGIRYRFGSNNVRR